MPLASADDDGELFADGESGGKGSSSSSDEVEFDFDDQPTPLPTYQPTPLPTYQPTPLPTNQPTPAPSRPTPVPTTQDTAALHIDVSYDKKTCNSSNVTIYSCFLLLFGLFGASCHSSWHGHVCCF